MMPVSNIEILLIDVPVSTIFHLPRIIVEDVEWIVIVFVQFHIVLLIESRNLLVFKKEHRENVIKKNQIQ